MTQILEQRRDQSVFPTTRQKIQNQRSICLFLFNSMIQNWLDLNGQGYSGDTIAWLGFLAHAPINKV